MKIHHDQLSANLERSLAPVYLIAGEEILFLQEAENTIRMAGMKAGFSERVRFTIDAGFDWSLFQQASQSISLFSDKQCIELNLSAGKLSEVGKKILCDYLQNPRSNKLLIIRTGKLDTALQKTLWYKAIEKIGVVIPVWPLAAAQMPAFIQQRLQKVGLQTDAAGLQLLAMRTEGNLLATVQEIEKLSLLYPKGHLTVEQLQEASSNNARYNVFSLIDVVLQGKSEAIVRVLKGLQEEAVEPILILWALTREARQWAQWLQAMEKGKTLAQMLAGNFVMEKRKHLITRVLQQHSLMSIYHCLQRAAHIDKVIKGAAIGAVWDELNILALSLSGSDLYFPPCGRRKQEIMMHINQTIGLLGGTFDPFHRGHLELALSIHVSLQLKEIRLIPCAQPLLRDPPIASPEQRLQMARIGAQDYSWLTVDDREIKRGGFSYTVDTVTVLRSEMPNTSLCFILSADQFLQFDQWKSWERILELVNIVVASRVGYSLTLNAHMQELTRRYQVYDAHLLHEKLFGMVCFQDIPSLPISGTNIRARLKAGKNVEDLVQPNVLKYIRENEVYSKI